MAQLQLTGGRDAWLSARTMDDLGRLMAAWLRAEVTYQPGYGDDTSTWDPETAALVDILAAVNEAGFMTDLSQPGQDDDGWRQRAAVTGYCSLSVAAQLSSALAHTELVVLPFPPGPTQGPSVVVTLDGHDEHTWVGQPTDPAELAHLYAADLHADAFVALAAAWQLHIIDPVWGRQDRLWPALRVALNGSSPTG